MSKAIRSEYLQHSTTPILYRVLYSSLKFLIFHLFVCKFFQVHAYLSSFLLQCVLECSAVSSLDFHISLNALVLSANFIREAVTCL